MPPYRDNPDSLESMANLGVTVKVRHSSRTNSANLGKLHRTSRTEYRLSSSGLTFSAEDVLLITGLYDITLKD